MAYVEKTSQKFHPLFLFSFNIVTRFLVIFQIGLIVYIFSFYTGIFFFFTINFHFFIFICSRIYLIKIYIHTEPIYLSTNRTIIFGSGANKGYIPKEMEIPIGIVLYAVKPNN